MFELLTEYTIPVLALSVSGVLFCLALIVLVSSRRTQRQQKKRYDNLYRDFRALTTAARTVGQRVLELERHQRNLAERQDQLNLYESANQPYEQAIRMAQRGADSQELVEVCGLSQGEAELVNLLHRLDKAS